MSATRDLWALITFIVGTGCAAAQEQPPPAVTTTNATVAVEPGGMPPSEATPTAYGDDQILGIVAAFNTGAIDAATIAQQRGTDARVRQLAKLLALEHTAARDQEARLSEQLSLRVTPTDRMRSLQLASTQERASLEALSGPRFDAEYLKNQVAAERDGLATLDVQLIPSARIPTMQAHLAELRDEVDHHLRDLEDLQRDVVASR
jgi:predicted outer membrane protein